MKNLLNTLFVLSENSYLSLDGDNIVISHEEAVIGRFPLHTLESILYFGYKGASPALMGACGQRDIALSFFTPTGRFLARVTGETRGNVLLRKKQYKLADDENASCIIARNFVAGKLHNCVKILRRAARDYPLRVDVEALDSAANQIREYASSAIKCEDLDILRGIEGRAASSYFTVFNELILQNKEAFRYDKRSKRPPLDNINALLSFAYTLLAHDCIAACESVGLDAYVGFLHRVRPGRASLALDLMEELRGILSDRLVLSVINNKEILPKHFIQKENGSVVMTDDGRKIFLGAWQTRKKEIITHPFLEEKVPWGLVPYTQALLLTRYIRGDLDGYLPFLWK